jgi:hypothetical protein
MELIEGMWEQPNIKLTRDADPAFVSEGYRGVFIQLGNMNGLTEDEITYIFNHELDHWAQRMSSGKSRGTRHDKLLYYLYDICERCNAFSQAENPGLRSKVELLQDFRRWAIHLPHLNW